LKNYTPVGVDAGRVLRVVSMTPDEAIAAQEERDEASADGQHLIASLEGLESGFKLNFDRLDFQANKEEFEKRFLISALKRFNGRINQTAIHANIPKKTLLRKLEKYGIVAREFTE
ncbi:MAG: hypothetical protein EOP84_36015, partial [Verrucomicrobiaceae bacterium]